MRVALVVDDDPVICRVVAHHIERAGGTAVVTGDGPAALALLRQVDAAVLCLDLYLPGMTAFEFLELARRDLGDRLPPVVLMTASGEEQVERQALAAGMAGVIRKPVGSRAIASLVLPYLTEAGPV